MPPGVAPLGAVIDVPCLWLIMGNCLDCQNSDSQEEDGSREETRRGGYENRRSRLSGYSEHDPILHPAPGISRPMSQLTEEEQLKIATRMGLISTLPVFKFDEEKREKLNECIICMCDYEQGDELRYLPCLHTYHRMCIDDWLMRALTCPSCLVELKPSSPQINRSTESACAVDLSGISELTQLPAEPPSYDSAVMETGNRNLRKRGDSVDTPVGVRSDGTEPNSPLSSVLPCKTPKLSSPRGKSTSNSNVSGGDCSNVILSMNVYSSNPGQHRRTRSNGIVVSRQDHTVQSELSHPVRHRRGNSMSDAAPYQVLGRLPLIRPQAPYSIERNVPPITITSQSVPPRQVDGDSS